MRAIGADRRHVAIQAGGVRGIPRHQRADAKRGDGQPLQVERQAGGLLVVFQLPVIERPFLGRGGRIVVVPDGRFKGDVNLVVMNLVGVLIIHHLQLRLPGK